MKDQIKTDMPHVIVYRDKSGCYTGVEVDGVKVPMTSQIAIYAGVKEITQVSLTIIAGDIEFVDEGDRHG